MKFIFVCFSAIITFELVICSPSDKSLCKDKRNFCVKPASIRLDGSVSLAAREFQRNAFEAYDSLCRRANRRNADPAVRTSAENIVKKIDDLCQVAFKVPSQITQNCCERPQNIWAAVEILKDLSRRATCFTSSVESTDASAAVNILFACVQASQQKCHETLAVKSPICGPVAEDQLASLLTPIQEYFMTDFLNDLPTVVQSNNCS